MNTGEFRYLTYLHHIYIKYKIKGATAASFPFLNRYGPSAYPI
jgi:hypothetical protein